METVTDLIVVTGPPGAGKSTVARVLSGLFSPSALVAGDQFLAFIDRGYIAPWIAAAHRQNEVVIEAAAAAAGRLAAGGYTVVYDGVLGPWFLETFSAAAGVDALHYVILLPPEQLCLERVRDRADHGFRDLEATRHMYAEFAQSAIDRRHVVDSTEDAAVIASQVFQLVQAGLVSRPAGRSQTSPG
jgi:energy-coupling factor transporter ATP-binding protein EcfA2